MVHVTGSPSWLVSLIKTAFPARFMLARLSRLGPVKRLMSKHLFEGDEIYYLPKDTTLILDQELPAMDSVPLPSSIVHGFIDKASHAWIMHECLCRSASKCKDHPVTLGCLFLGEDVTGINPALGREVTREEAHAHVRVCQEAGLVQLIGKNRLDAGWLMVPGSKLLTICNCCPCCCLWRVLPALHPDLSGHVRKLDGVSISVTGRCTGCGTCEKGACFVDAIHVIDGKARITAQCRGCGRCADACPSKAIEVRVSDPSYLDGPADRIDAIVDVK